MGIGNPVHLIFIAAVALIVLGPKRLPELARSLGNGMREFKDSMSEAVNGEEESSPIVPQQAQLVAAAEPTISTPVDAVVVDPASPERPAVAPERPAAAEQSLPPAAT